MGNSPSAATRSCLVSAVGGVSSNVAWQDELLYRLENVKTYNLQFPVAPIAITYPETSEQIAEVVRCAVEAGHAVQARSGGHSYGNYGLGGPNADAIVVDLKHFQQFDMDYTTYKATIGAGMLLGDVTTRLYNAGGRAMSHGTCPQVGSGGHLTIGGLGPTSRQFGTALDHVVEMEVVLANSSIIRASATENPDIFFAMKGAGASFGIVTEFTVRTEPAPGQAVRYSFIINLGSSSEKAQLFTAWQDFISDPTLDRRFSSLLVVFEEGIVLSGTFFGSQAEFEEFKLEKRFPITAPGNIVVLQSWLGMLTNEGESLIEKAIGGIPVSFYAKSMSFTPETLMQPSTVDQLFQYIDSTSKGTLAWFVIFDLEGGATNDVLVNATAYAHRNTLYWMQSYAVSLLGSVSQTTLDFLDGINNLISSAAPGCAFGAYAGYVDPYMDGAESAYWGPNLERLRTIKAAVDPLNVFRNPQSVQSCGK